MVFLMVITSKIKPYVIKLIFSQRYFTKHSFFLNKTLNHLKCQIRDKRSLDFNTTSNLIPS